MYYIKPLFVVLDDFTVIWNVFLSCDKVSIREKNEASSSEGSSTPFSKRKGKDQVDQTSTSKKMCTKLVKMENIKDDDLNV